MGIFKNIVKMRSEKSYRDLESDLKRNNYGNGHVVNCKISNDEYTVTIDIDGSKFEMTYGQASLIFMALHKMYFDRPNSA